MYENAFNSIERELRNEDGIANELDYVEQISWVQFLKYLHDLETERRDRAELDGETYTPIIDGPFRWDRWAAPKTNVRRRMIWNRRPDFRSEGLSSSVSGYAA